MFVAVDALMVVMLYIIMFGGLFVIVGFWFGACLVGLCMFCFLVFVALVVVWFVVLVNWLLLVLWFPGCVLLCLFGCLAWIITV